MSTLERLDEFCAALHRHVATGRALAADHESGDLGSMRATTLDMAYMAFENWMQLDEIETQASASVGAE